MCRGRLGRMRGWDDVFHVEQIIDTVNALAHTQPHTLMSATAAKATRRQLRRSVGDTALGAIVEQGQQVTDLSARINGHTVHLTRIDEQLTAQRIALAAWTHTDRVVRSLTFYQRLRWLFTGIIHGLS